MITFIEGIPGSGKTAYAVIQLFEKYIELDYSGNYKLKDDVYLFHNVSDLEFGKEIGGIEIIKDLNLEFVDEFRQQKNYKELVFIFDECHELFPSNMYEFFNKDERKYILEFFTRSRKYNLDIYLLTQSRSSCWSKIPNLSEVHLEAMPRSKSFPGFLCYRNKKFANALEKIKLTKERKMYLEYYRTAEIPETLTKKPFRFHYIPRILALFSVIFIGYVIYSFKADANNFEKKFNNKTKSIEQTEKIKQKKEAAEILSIPNIDEFVYCKNYSVEYGDKINIRVFLGGEIYSLPEIGKENYKLYSSDNGKIKLKIRKSLIEAYEPKSNYEQNNKMDRSNETINDYNTLKITSEEI